VSFPESYADEIINKQRRMFGEWLMEQQDQMKPKPTDRKLARIIGMSATQVGNVKKGTTGIKPETAVKIANAFGRPPNEIFELAGLPVDKDYEPDLRLARRLHAVIGDLPEGKRQSVELALEAFAVTARQLVNASP
jgi:plasmid maintenance system antidote protein VapI